MINEHLKEDLTTRCIIYNEAAQALKQRGYITEINNEVLTDIMRQDGARIIDRNRNAIRDQYRAQMYNNEIAHKCGNVIRTMGYNVSGIMERVTHRLRQNEFAQFIHYTAEETAQYLTVENEKITIAAQA